MRRFSLTLAVVALLLLPIPSTSAVLGQDDELQTLSAQIDKLYATGRYREALPLSERPVELTKARFGENDARYAASLNGLATFLQFTGSLDRAEQLLRQALAIDPNYTKVREYLGEAYLQKGDVAEAKEQLMEIADRCGGPCDDYELLAKAIAAHVTGEKIVDW